MSSRAKRMTVAATLVLLLTSCAESQTPNTDGRSAAQRPTSTGKINIIHPQPGQSVQGTTYKVRFEVIGARVLEQASTDVRPDTGHVHLALDGNTVTLLAGLEFELKDLTPGQHLLQAEFAAADHGPFRPRVIDTVTFNVQ